jgi:hypothetical protein
MLRMRLCEERDASFGVGTQGQTTSDRLIEEVLDIVPEKRVLEFVLCQTGSLR